MPGLRPLRFRPTAAGEIKLLEVNPNPGWCWDGKLNYMAGWAGLRYADVLHMIVDAAQETHRSKDGQWGEEREWEWRRQWVALIMPERFSPTATVGQALRRFFLEAQAGMGRGGEGDVLGEINITL